MLDAQTIATVKATIPLLVETGTIYNAGVFFIRCI